MKTDKKIVRGTLIGLAMVIVSVFVAVFVFIGNRPKPLEAQRGGNPAYTTQVGVLTRHYDPEFGVACYWYSRGNLRGLQCVKVR